MRARYESSVTSPKLEGFDWQEPDNVGDLASFRHIVKDGCSILGVHPDDAESGPPYDFMYTVGFYLNLQHPELFIKGLLGSNVGAMMNALFCYVEAGNKIKDGEVVRYDLGDGEKRFVAKTFPLDRYFDYLGWGCWFYRSLLWKVSPIAEHKFPVLQLFWPDPLGYYPWEDQCDSRVRDIQTPRAIEAKSMPD